MKFGDGCLGIGVVLASRLLRLWVMVLSCLGTGVAFVLRASTLVTTVSSRPGTGAVLPLRVLRLWVMVSSCPLRVTGPGSRAMRRCSILLSSSSAVVELVVRVSMLRLMVERRPPVVAELVVRMSSLSLAISRRW